MLKKFPVRSLHKKSSQQTRGKRSDFRKNSESAGYRKCTCELENKKWQSKFDFARRLFHNHNYREVRWVT